MNMILIDNEKYKVYTKRVGNNSKIKLLLLHGGPGCTHEYFEIFENYLPNHNIEFYYYDQLGSAHSDQPEDPSLWTLPRFVEEVEQVRIALNLNKDNFYLLGHSWGGILAAEYALKYQKNLKGLIISNMMMSSNEYNKYAQVILAKQFAGDVLKEIRDIEASSDFSNPRYMELLIPNFYCQHVLRLPYEKWPNAVNRAMKNLNQTIYCLMQGPSEFGMRGTLENWDITKRLKEIEVPTLSIASTYDTMDPEHMKWISTQVQKGSYLLCPNGSHMCMWDDTENYISGLVSWMTHSATNTN